MILLLSMRIRNDADSHAFVKDITSLTQEVGMHYEDDDDYYLRDVEPQATRERQKNDIKRKKRPTLTIAVISNNRYSSLVRLCESLLGADYSQNSTFFSGSIDLIVNLEANSQKRIVDYAMDLRWPYGEKNVRKRLLQGGLIRAVSESWFPSSEDDYGVLLEDDIEVSPQYFNWINKVMHLSHHGAFSRILGISLYSPKLTETTNPQARFESNELIYNLIGEREHPYLMQTPCSWGAVYFPGAWRRFRRYMSYRLQHEEVGANNVEYVSVPQSRTNGWKKSWKRYMFEFMYLEGKFLLYPNFEGGKSLSKNHMENGEHISLITNSHDKRHYMVQLLDEKDKIRIDDLHVDMDNIPVIDVFGLPLHTAKSLSTALDDAQQRWDTRSPTSSIHRKSQTLDRFEQCDTMESQEDRILESQISIMPQYSMFVFRLILQNDGVLALYRTDRLNSTSHDVPVWSSKSFVGIHKGVHYRVKLSHQGALFLSQHVDAESNISIDSNILRSNALFKTTEDSVTSSTKNRKYHLRLESSGILIIYRGENDCKRSNVVWMSDNQPLGPKWPPERCITSQRERLCQTFPVRTTSKFKGEGFTILISSHRRFRTLLSQLQYYSASPLVHSIIVTWHNMRVASPQTSMLNGTMVRFIVPEVDSLNNRFLPLPFIYTECVTIIDDDMKVHLQDVHNLFHVWRMNRRAIVGVSPRWLRPNSMKPREMEYSYHSEDPPYIDGEPDLNSPPSDGYSLMLTKAMMIHRDYLRLYSCGGKSLSLKDMKCGPEFTRMRRKIHRIVDAHFNCEDIGMNFVVAAALKGTNTSAPLFVKPLHRIGDFGKDQSGLHLRQSHVDLRAACLKQFKKEFLRVVGRGLLPRKVMINSAFNKDLSEAVLTQVVYHGNRLRMHQDCNEFAKESSDASDPCSWKVPENSFSSQYLIK